MEVSIKDVEKILSKRAIIEIENKIADIVGCKIYKENVAILLKLVQQNIMKSNINIDEIVNVMLNKSNNIIKLATNFLIDEKIENLGLGISVLYTIYWIYLESKTEQELLDYLKRRRIPNVNKVAMQLHGVYSKL